MIPSMRRLAAAAVAATTLLLTGCGGGNSLAGDGEGLRVLAGFYPLEWTAARVGGDRITVSSLTPPGAEAHDLELTPRDVGAIADADVLVYLAGFQPAVDEAVDAEAKDVAWDAGSAAHLSLMADAHGDAEVAHGDKIADPHFWLDPLRVAAVGDALADRLAVVDPDNADYYRHNAASLRADLEDLDTEMQSALSDCRVDTLVTAHDAFGYLGDRYGFDVVGIGGLSPSQEPDPAGIAQITDLVKDHGITTVYTETLVDPAVAETVAREAGVETAVLDPIEGLTEKSAGHDYLEVMRANMASLQEGQACA